MDYRGYIFDLDGTIYLGERLIPGADRAIEIIRAEGCQVVFLSNKPIATPGDYAVKLEGLGIPCGPEDVINSLEVTVRFLSSEMPGARIHLVGERVLRDALVGAGMAMASDPRSTDLVLISLDRGLSYDKIHFAYHAAKSGARVLATNPDVVCPVDGDEIVDAGATIGAIEAMLGRPIDGVIGKPSPIMVKQVADRIDLDPSDCLMVGDRLETDIAMGRAAGMATALVLTGVTDRARLADSEVQPDLVLESVADLVDVAEGAAEPCR